MINEEILVILISIKIDTYQVNDNNPNKSVVHWGWGSPIYVVSYGNF